MNSNIRKMASDIFDEALKQGVKLEELRFISTPYVDGGHRLVEVSAEIEITNPVKTKFDEIIVAGTEQEEQ